MSLTTLNTDLIAVAIALLLSGWTYDTLRARERFARAESRFESTAEESSRAYSAFHSTIGEWRDPAAAARELGEASTHGRRKIRVDRWRD